MALTLLFVPGVVAALLMRLRLIAALAVGPVLTTTCLSVGGIVAPVVGLRWGPVALALAVLLLWAGAAAVGVADRRLRARWGGPWFADPEQERPAGANRQRLDPVLVATLVGLGIAFVVFLASVLPQIRTPEEFPQHPDTIYHLITPQWMINEGTISSLTAGYSAGAQAGGFYPAAFHGFTATISLLTGTNVVVSTSVFVLAVAGVAWPLGCVALALTLFGRRPVVALAAGVTSVLFTGFPYFLMGFGVVWPNLFGGALLPACLAAVAAVLGSRSRPGYAVADRTRAVVLVVVMAPGLALAHPNAFVSFAFISSVIVVGRLLGSAWARRRRPRRALVPLAATAAVLVAWAVALVFVRPRLMYTTGTPGPEASARAAWDAVLRFSPRDTMPLDVLAVVVAVGAVVVLLKYRGTRWLVAALVLILTLFWLSVAVDSDATRLLTWPWYNNAVRIQAYAVLPAVMLATAAVVALRDLLARYLTFRLGAQVASAVVVAALLLATGGGYTTAHANILHRYFHPKLADSWVTDAELQSLRTLSLLLPPDAVVAANPWNGGTYLYVVSGRRLLVPTEKANFPGDRALLSKRLDAVGSDPAVCAAAQRQHVEWAITGGEPFSWVRDRMWYYTGVDDVGSSPAWREVARSGDYTLYHRTGCAQG